MIEQLLHTLLSVRALAGDKFSGIGVVVYTPGTSLPIYALRPAVNIRGSEDIVSSLARIASVHSEFHDGFHLISDDWRLTHVAQYFAPPIPPDVDINPSRRGGARYVTALFGSLMPGVSLCGVASIGFGLAILQSGAEVHFEPLA